MQYLKRLKPMILPVQNSAANTIYVDSDTNEIKVGTGASGSTERVLVDSASFGSISDDLLPSANDTYDIGSTTFIWNELFISKILAGDGTAAAPAYSFASLGSNSGTYGFNAGSFTALGWSTNGVVRAALGANALTLKSDLLLGWSSGDPQTTGADVSLSRGAADVLQLANGDTFKHGTGAAGFGSTSTTGTLVTNDAQTVANAGIISLGASIGHVTVTMDTNDVSAFVRFDSGTVVLISGNSSFFTVTAGTASRINIYWSVGNARFELQNNMGSARNIRVIRLGV